MPELNSKQNQSLSFNQIYQIVKLIMFLACLVVTSSMDDYCFHRSQFSGHKMFCSEKLTNKSRAKSQDEPNTYKNCNHQTQALLRAFPKIRFVKVRAKGLFVASLIFGLGLRARAQAYSDYSRVSELKMGAQEENCRGVGSDI